MTLEESARPAQAGALQLARASIARARALLVDWDGCLALGEDLMPGAVAFLRRYEDRVVIVSNNTTHLPEDFLLTLRRHRLRLPPERVVLAGREAVCQAVETAPAGRALVLANARLRALARAAGLEPQSDTPEVVVLLRDTDFSYERLQRAVDALGNGVPLIVGNPDVTHPGRNGSVVPETGALLAALSAVVDLGKIEYRIVGKPQPALFRRACATMGVQPDRAIMIGDNPATDGAGATALGMASILVGRSSELSLAALL